jgi:single-strand DNA-binding protein
VDEASIANTARFTTFDPSILIFMAGLNKVILIGNLGKDPEMRNLENGVVTVRFTLATSENYLDKEGNRQTLTEWHTIVFWRKQAENAGKYLKKGMSVYVEGKLKTRSWEDENKIKRYSTEIEGDRFIMLDKRQDEGTTPNSTYGNSQPAAVSGGVKSGMEDVSDDLPF